MSRFLNLFAASRQRLFRNSFLLGVLCAFVLVAGGFLMVPETRIWTAIPVSIVLSGYALTCIFGRQKLQKHTAEILSTSSRLGLFAAIVFVAEIILEYAVLPDDNSRMGLLEFAIVFVTFALAGGLVTYRTGSLRVGATSAIATAMISSLVWYVAVLSIFYCFFGTLRQHRVFLAEGNYDDFTRSELHNFNAFIMEDFLGAGFFHLLLGPMIASALGLIGGLIAMCFRRWR